MARNNKNELSLREKLELIRCIDNGMSCRKASEAFKVSKPTACNIMKRKQEYLKYCEENTNLDSCRKIRNTDNRAN